MSEYDDLAERLRAADPAASLEPVGPDRLAQLLEVTMNTKTDKSEPRKPVAWIAVVAAAAVVIIAMAGGALLLFPGDKDTGLVANPSQSSTPGGDETTPSSVTVAAPDPAAYTARCMPPSAELLQNADLAVDATVTSVSDGQVTLSVNDTFHGTKTDQVVVESPPKALSKLLVSVDFVKGERYLLAASDGKVMICGMTAPYSAELERVYGQSFAR